MVVAVDKAETLTECDLVDENESAREAGPWEGAQKNSSVVQFKVYCVHSTHVWHCSGSELCLNKNNKEEGREGKMKVTGLDSLNSRPGRE